MIMLKSNRIFKRLLFMPGAVIQGVQLAYFFGHKEWSYFTITVIQWIICFGVYVTSDDID